MEKNVKNKSLNSNYKNKQSFNEFQFHIKNHYRKPKELNFQNSSNFFTKKNYTDTYSDYYQKFLNNNKKNNHQKFEDKIINKRFNNNMNHSDFELNKFNKTIFPYLRLKKQFQINYLENYEKQLRNENEKLNQTGMYKKYKAKNMNLNNSENILFSDNFNNRSRISFKTRLDFPVFKKVKKFDEKILNKKKKDKNNKKINNKIKKINIKLQKLINSKLLNKDEVKKNRTKSNKVSKKKSNSLLKKLENNNIMDINNLLTLKLIDPNLKIVK